MLFGVGCDLCEIARMEQSLFGPHGEAFEARVFGEAERQALALDSCREAPKKAKNDHGDTVRQSALNVSRRAHKAASAAADFAAKEAFLKAAGTGLREPFALRDIEAVRLESGAPTGSPAPPPHGWPSTASALTSPSATRAAWRWPSACWKPDLLLRIQWNSPRVHTGRRRGPY